MSDTIEQSARATTPSELHPKIEEMLTRIGRDAEAGVKSGTQDGAEGTIGPERAEAVAAFARALLRRLADDDPASHPEVSRPPPCHPRPLRLEQPPLARAHAQTAEGGERVCTLKGISDFRFSILDFRLKRD